MPGPVPPPVLVSYGVVFVVLVLAGWLHLTTPLITILFSYFVLRSFSFWKSKLVAISAFLIVVAALFWAFVFFLKIAFVALPEIVRTSTSVAVQFATAHGVDLPFTDVASLKEMATDSVVDALGYVGNFAKLATKESVFLLVGIVISIAIFINPTLDPQRGADATPKDLYSFSAALIAERFSAFYRSFETVMGAQMLISGINTVLTAFFVFGCQLRYGSVLVAVTFACGFLPVVGNLISNTLIVGIAFTKSPQMAGWALAFLVLVHKLEYFLNSKIVGSRIRHPMWLTLLALILGERLMGIPGLILAPVVLNFVKVEGSKYPVRGQSVGELTSLTLSPPVAQSCATRE